MRSRWLAMVIVAAAMACGPSNAEVKTARTAVYKTTAEQVMTLAIEATQESYKIADRDAAEIVTVPKFYTATGDLESAGAGDVVQLREGSVRVVFHVKIVPSGADRVAVVVTPETLQLVAGSPMPRKLEPNDPYLPPFVLGRADSLALAIYERAKPYVAPP